MAQITVTPATRIYVIEDKEAVFDKIQKGLINGPVGFLYLTRETLEGSEKISININHIVIVEDGA